MAKVLACPSCGRKHPLELLVGLDSFVCNGCNKTLAVPSEASEINKVEQKSSVHEDIQVIAHSTMNQSQLDEAKPAQSKISDASPVDTETVEQKAPEASKQPKNNLNVPKVPVGIFSSVFIWAVSILGGFVFVVIFPRIIGYGFHASDFLGVITNQGISRYKIVMALILLWSFASVVFVYALSFLFKKLFLVKKLAR
ncbi:MAG: hypothetical protein U0R17_07375 [Acidimicrobiia bacterium]